MKPFTYGQRKLVFWSEAGTVLSQNKYSESHLSVTNGRTYVDNNQVSVQSPRIHSTVTTKHEFWIRLKDGTEKSCKLVNKDIPLRVGQDITLIGVAWEGVEEGYYCALINHNAKKHWSLYDADELNLVLTIEQITGKSFLLAGTGAVLFGVLLQSILAGLVVGLGVMIYRTIRKVRKRAVMRKELNTHLHELIQQAHSL